MIQDIFDLVAELRARGKKNHRDHFTLMAFSTHWKATFDHIDVDSGRGRDQIANLPDFKSAEEAMRRAIAKEKASIIIPEEKNEEMIRRIVDGAVNSRLREENREMSLEIDRLNELVETLKN